MKARFTQPSLTLVATTMVLLIAVLAGGSLWALRLMHAQLAHARAARSVLDQGARLTEQLAGLPVVRAASDSADWQSLSPLVRSLHSIERDLQYVSVTCDGVTVFHEQTSGLDGSMQPPAAAPQQTGEVRMTRKILNVGTQAIPVVVFASRFQGEDGKPRLLELALRKDAVERQASAPSDALATMFRIALLTIIVSFFACALLVLWVMRRERMREGQRRAEEHLAFAGVLANGIVHDFRNPMSSLRLDVQMMHKEAAKGADSRPGRVSELAERVRTTLDRMDKVFQEFLYLSRPARGAAETFDLVECLRECAAMLAPRFEQKHVKVEFEADGAAAVSGQRASLQRAFINVLTNAEQFSPEGGTVTVRVRPGAEHCVAEVMDRGPGIPAADQKRIFEMFHSGRPGGTGLGLFLAKTAVEGAGGRIEADNRPGGGACIRIALRASAAPQPATEGEAGHG